MALTKMDLKAIRELMEDVFDIKIEERTQDLLVTKEEMRHLPTKEEFYVSEDKLMKELKDIRE